jgi:hypothetical protein
MALPDMMNALALVSGRDKSTDKWISANNNLFVVTCNCE